MISEAMRPGAGDGRAATRILVIGNEKGGTGKSTTAMHLVVGLMRAGWRVGTLDLDAGQGTLTRYVENRRACVARLVADGQLREASDLVALPRHRAVHRAADLAGEAARSAEAALLEQAIAALAPHCDIIIADTPGSDTTLSQAGHALADILVTPINDSLLDLDVLARLDPEDMRVLAPSRYSAMVWEQRKQRALRRLPPIDWVVLRNRVTASSGRDDAGGGDRDRRSSARARARSHRESIAAVLERLGPRVGFRLAPGLGERTLYRELFLQGLTTLDLRDLAPDTVLDMAHVAARQEVRALIAALDLGRPGTAPGQGDVAARPVAAVR